MFVLIANLLAIQPGAWAAQVSRGALLRELRAVVGVATAGVGPRALGSVTLSLQK